LAAVTTAKLRPAVLIALLTSLVAALTACGSGPSQVNSAVIIGEKSISVNEVQTLLDKVVAEQPAAAPLAKERKLDLIAREALSQLIVHEVLAETAARENLRVDPEQLNQLLSSNPLGEELPTDGSVPAEQLAAQLVYRARDVRDYATDQLLLAELASRDLGRVSLTYNLVQIEKAEDANSLAERIAANPEQSAELMTDASGEAAPPQLDSNTGPTPDGVYLTAPEGSVFVLPAGQGAQGGGFQVVHVLSREVSETQDPSYDPSSVDPAQLPALGQFALREEAMNADIEVSPRYGVWNDVTLAVVSKLEADVSGMVLTPGSAQP
jgi:hypothetical protein